MSQKINKEVDINSIIEGRLNIESVRRSVAAKFGFYIDNTNIFNCSTVNKVLSLQNENKKLFFQEIGGLYWELADRLFKEKHKEFTNSVWETSQ
jgi:hypothetical protein